MNAVKKGIEVAKKLVGKVVNKLGVFNIVLIIALLFAMFYIGGKSWQGSFTTINVHFDQNVQNVKYDVQMGKELSETVVTTEKNEVIISTYTRGNWIDHIELTVPSEDINCTAVEVTSRNRSLKTFDVTDENCIVERSAGATKIVFSSELLTELDKALRDDWKLNLEVMLIVFMFFLAIKGIELFFTYKVYKRFSYICLFILFLFFVKAYGNPTTLIHIKDLNINGYMSTTPVSEEEFFYQTFIPEKNTKGIRVQLATYGDVLQGTYEARIYDEADNCVTNLEIPGAEVIDNQYYYIDFAKRLDEGKTYKFTIVKTDTEFTDENMCLWRTETNHYTDGELIDITEAMTGDVEFDLYEDGLNMQTFLLFIVMVCFVILLLCKKGNEDEKHFNIYAIAVYLGVLIIFLSKTGYFAEYKNLGIYDEMAHVSFVTYFTENPNVFVPEYENATLLVPEHMKLEEDQMSVVALNQNKGIFYGRKSGTINYLFHPSLYYKLMSMTNSVTSDGELVHVNIDRLRIVNVAIIVFALLIIFYIGLTRIQKNMYYHLLFASICTGLSALYQMAPMVNNDNLCLLAIAIYMLGLIRVSEGKRDLFSYLCIAVGIMMAAFTKLTALLFVAIISVFFVLRVCIKEKSVAVLLNKAFIITIPIYAVVVWYYLQTYMMYGTFKVYLSLFLKDAAMDYPVLFKSAADRVFVDLPRMLQLYIESFTTTWSQQEEKFVASTGLFECVRFLRNTIFVLPLAIPLFDLKSKKRENTARTYIMQGVSVAVVFAFFYQIISGVDTFYGSTGRFGSQSRYYLCMLPLFAYSIVHFLSSKVEHKYGQDTKIVSGEKSISVNAIIHFIISACALILLTA